MQYQPGTDGAAVTDVRLHGSMSSQHPELRNTSSVLTQWIPGFTASGGASPGRPSDAVTDSLHKFCQVTASSVRAVAAVTWGPVCHGRNRDRRERMLLDGSAVSAVSRSRKKPIQPAESSAPQRLLIRLTGNFRPTGDCR